MRYLGILVLACLTAWGLFDGLTCQSRALAQSIATVRAYRLQDFEIRPALFQKPAKSENKWQPVEITTYGPEYRHPKHRTSSGARYDYRALTAAVLRHGRKPAIPFGTVVEVRYGSRTVTVTITDTGGHKPKHGGMWFDLSDAAMAGLLGKPLNPSKAYQTTVRAQWRTY